MSEWKVYQLGEVCSRLRSGKGIKADFVSDTGEYPVIGGNGVRGFTDSYNFEGQAAVIGRQGAYCGNVRFYEGKAYMTEHAVVVVGNELADTYYLACLLSRMHLGNLSGQSAQPGISVQTLSKQILRLPSILYQKQVSAVIKTLDDKIAVNKKICENLEAQAQALFKHWFVDFAPFKDGKFVESELGLIPEGWRVGTLSDLGEIVGGATPSKAESSYFTDKGIPWLTPKDLSNDLKKFTSRGEIAITEDGYNSCSAKIMPRGSVLFSSRAPIGYLTIAKNSICTNQGFKSVVPKYAGTAYIYYLLKTNTKRIENMSSGTTFKEASGSLMKSLAVIIPPKNIIDNYEASVVELFNEQEVIEEESSCLSTLRDTLLPKLMSGQIKVDDLK